MKFQLVVSHFGRLWRKNMSGCLEQWQFKTGLTEDYTEQKKSHLVRWMKQRPGDLSHRLELPDPMKFNKTLWLWWSDRVGHLCEAKCVAHLNGHMKLTVRAKLIAVDDTAEGARCLTARTMDIISAQWTIWWLKTGPFRTGTSSLWGARSRFSKLLFGQGPTSDIWHLLSWFSQFLWKTSNPWNLYLCNRNGKYQMCTDSSFSLHLWHFLVPLVRHKQHRSGIGPHSKPKPGNKISS